MKSALFRLLMLSVLAALLLPALLGCNCSSPVDHAARASIAIHEKSLDDMAHSIKKVADKLEALVEKMEKCCPAVGKCKCCQKCGGCQCCDDCSCKGKCGKPKHPKGDLPAEPASETFLIPPSPSLTLVSTERKDEDLPLSRTWTNQPPSFAINAGTEILIDG